MTGIEMIAKERQEQIEKHGYTLESDQSNNSDQLTYAARILSFDYPKDFNVTQTMCPDEWSPEIWHYMLSKPRIERLAIAGALIAAEIDRIK